MLLLKVLCLELQGCQRLQRYSSLTTPTMLSLQVYLMKSLLRPSEYPTPVCTTINYTLSFKAFWTPRREDRITLLSQRGPRQVSKFVTFDIELERTEDGIDAKGKPYHLRNFSSRA